MKRIIIICIVIISTYQLSSQITLDIGNDLIACFDVYKIEEKITLGESPIAYGGVEPYNFTWSGKMLIDSTENTWIYASDILDDTTKSNPIVKIIDIPNNWFTLHLKVEDTAENFEIDSIKIIQSFFEDYPVYRPPVTIKKGDSVQFFGDIYFSSNFPIIKYIISPIDGLTDSTNIYGWAKPDASITYYLQAVNSVGCVSYKIEYWRINVDTTTYSNNEVGNTEAQCYLSDGILIIHVPSFKNSPFQLTVTTVDGRIIHSGKYNSHPLRLPDLGLKPRQLYLVSIRNGRKKSVCKLFF